MTLGTRIRTARLNFKEKGKTITLSQLDLAWRVNTMQHHSIPPSPKPVTARMISDYERGVKKPPVQTIMRLEHILGKDLRTDPARQLRAAAYEKEKKNEQEFRTKQIVRLFAPSDEARLRIKWGDNFDRNLRRAQDFAHEHFTREVIDTYGSYPCFVEAVYELSAQYREVPLPEHKFTYDALGKVAEGKTIEQHPQDEFARQVNNLYANGNPRLRSKIPHSNKEKLSDHHRTTHLPPRNQDMLYYVATAAFTAALCIGIAYLIFS